MCISEFRTYALIYYVLSLNRVYAVLLRKCVLNEHYKYSVTYFAQFLSILWALIIMQNGQRFVVMYLLYGGSYVLVAPKTVAGGDRAALQEQGNR